MPRVAHNQKDSVVSLPACIVPHLALVNSNINFKEANHLESH
jgi:hypothetical protein